MTTQVWVSKLNVELYEGSEWNEAQIHTADLVTRVF